LNAPIAAAVEEPAFLFTTCQVGAEPALKSEIGRRWPEFRFAFSRPGFVTFKLPPHHALRDDFDLNSVFARAYGFSLGKLQEDNLEAIARGAWQLGHRQPWEALHVWQRDTAAAGYRDFEPGITPAALEAQAALLATAPHELSPAAPTPVGQLVFDCVLVEPRQWWIGYHRTRLPGSCWPGGLMDIPLPAGIASRAYLKMNEALAWSQFPIHAGQSWVEIGCSPGGASQALLLHGAKVLGVDPADVEPAVLANRNFTHIKKRGADVRRREFRHVRWLAADMNVAPEYTLDTVEAIVTHDSVDIHGLLLTLKLIDWRLAGEVDHYVERVRSWGYGLVRARQLQHNRQEICLAAARDVKVLKAPKPARRMSARRSPARLKRKT